ncbi:DMT family transporter [Azorhizobium doebereinerae]|uniref:DMT family transporter n=1 Tax=Azorhizobium doebereinerae TaxID=281091 RepID=UPI00040792C9|nr:DMT family transporter [Azorhizobium doebereinerae]
MTASADPATAGRSLRLGLIGAVLTVLIWTTWIVSTRFAMQGRQPLAPALLAFIRFGTATIILAPAWWRFRLIPRKAPPLALLGLMAAGLPYQFLVLWGLHYAPAGEAGPLLAGTLPLFIALLSAVALGERITAPRVAGVALITVGVIAITGRGLFDMGAGTWRGHLAILAGSLAWSVYTVAFRYSRLTGLEAAAFVGLWSVIVLVPFGAGEIWAAAQATPGMVLAQQFVTQGVLAGVVALLTYTTAVRNLGAARATALTALTPPAALLTAVFLLGERPDLTQLAGCALIVAGVVAASGVLGARSRPVV